MTSAMTVRLDPAVHNRLRVASFILNEPAVEIVRKAVEAYLATVEQSVEYKEGAALLAKVSA